MSQRYPGGLIRKTPPTVTGPTDGEGGSAPGIWTLEEVAYYEKEGGWPKPVLPRELYSWGDNANGKLGQNTPATADLSSPVQVGSLTTWQEISASNNISMAIKSDGTLWVWGGGAFGALGTNDTINVSSPVQIGALTTWDKISCGFFNGFAIKTDGTLWSWGYNQVGQLGQNDVNIHRSSPVQIGSDTNWSYAEGGAYTCLALKTDGTLWSWGYGFDGELGLNSNTNRSSPTQVGALTTWLTVGSRAYTVAAIKTDGTLWAWGKNNKGQLGLNLPVTTNVSSPIQVGALTTWSKAESGINFSAGIKTDGTLWTWGDNGRGQLGQNIATNIDRSSPVQVGSDTNWSLVSLGGNYSAVSKKTNDTLWAWGRNLDGELGLGNTTYVSSPIQVGSDTNWDKAVAGYAMVLGLTKG